MTSWNWKTAAVAAVAILGSLPACATGQRLAATFSGPALLEQPAGAAQPAALEPQAKDELLDGLDRLGANAKEKNEVNLDRNMMGLAAGKKGGRYADLAQKMDFIVVRNYEFASRDQYRQSDLNQLRQRLESNGWSHLVRNESGSDINDICVRTDVEGLIRDMVILNAEPKELNIVHLRGHFRMEDVQGAMGSAMGMSRSLGPMVMGPASSHTRATPAVPATPAMPASPAMPATPSTESTPAHR